MKRGDLVTVTATIDSFRDGLISGRQVRVNVNGTLIWVPIKLTDIEEQEKREGILEYMQEEMQKRCVGGPADEPCDNRSIDDGFDAVVEYNRKEDVVDEE